MGAIRVTQDPTGPDKTPIYTIEWLGEDRDASLAETRRWILRGDLPDVMGVRLYGLLFMFASRGHRRHWWEGFFAGLAVTDKLDERLRCNECNAYLVTPEHPGSFRCKKCKADYSLGKDGRVTRIWGKDCGVPY